MSLSPMLAGTGLTESVQVPSRRLLGLPTNVAVLGQVLTRMVLGTRGSWWLPVGTVVLLAPSAAATAMVTPTMHLANWRRTSPRLDAVTFVSSSARSLSAALIRGDERPPVGVHTRD